MWKNVYLCSKTPTNEESLPRIIALVPATARNCSPRNTFDGSAHRNWHCCFKAIPSIFADIVCRLSCSQCSKHLAELLIQGLEIKNWCSCLASLHILPVQETRASWAAEAYVDRASFPGFLDETEFKCCSPRPETRERFWLLWKHLQTQIQNSQGTFQHGTLSFSALNFWTGCRWMSMDAD